MNHSTPALIPEAITQLQRRLEEFRSAQPTRTKLPESLRGGGGFVPEAEQQKWSGWQPGVVFRECELNDVNAFDCLTELLRHPEEFKQNPPAWMPWNYRETLTRLATPAAA